MQQRFCSAELSLFVHIMNDVRESLLTFFSLFLFFIILYSYYIQMHLFIFCPLCYHPIYSFISLPLPFPHPSFTFRWSGAFPVVRSAYRSGSRGLKIIPIYYVVHTIKIWKILTTSCTKNVCLEVWECASLFTKKIKKGVQPPKFQFLQGSIPCFFLPCKSAAV